MGSRRGRHSIPAATARGHCHAHSPLARVEQVRKVSGSVQRNVLGEQGMKRPRFSGEGGWAYSRPGVEVGVE